MRLEHAEYASTRRRRNRTFQAVGCTTLPALKAGAVRALGHPLGTELATSYVTESTSAWVRTPQIPEAKQLSGLWRCQPRLRLCLVGLPLSFRRSGSFPRAEAASSSCAPRRRRGLEPGERCLDLAQVIPDNPLVAEPFPPVAWNQSADHRRGVARDGMISNHPGAAGVNGRRDLAHGPNTRELPAWTPCC